MAIVAKMLADKVEEYGGPGGLWEKCEEDDEGAMSLFENGSPAHNLYTDPPQWLLGTGFVRRRDGKYSETIHLKAVTKGSGTDPEKTNAQWAIASPSGELTLTIHNPEAWGYVRVGHEYRITIERVRGPREKSD